jgi:hypothetical protein
MAILDLLYCYISDSVLQEAAMSVVKGEAWPPLHSCSQRICVVNYNRDVRCNNVDRAGLRSVVTEKSRSGPGLRSQVQVSVQVSGQGVPETWTWDLRPDRSIFGLKFFPHEGSGVMEEVQEWFWWTPVDDIPTNNKEFGHPQVVSDLSIFQQRKNLFTELVKGGRDTSEIQCVIRFGKKWTCPILFLQKYSFMINLKKKTYHILFLFFLVVIMLILLFWSF